MWATSFQAESSKVSHPSNLRRANGFDDIAGYERRVCSQARVQPGRDRDIRQEQPTNICVGPEESALGKSERDGRCRPDARVANLTRCRVESGADVQCDDGRRLVIRPPHEVGSPATRIFVQSVANQSVDDDVPSLRLIGDLDSDASSVNVDHEREHLLTRHFNVVRLAGVILRHRDDLVLGRRAHLEAALTLHVLGHRYPSRSRLHSAQSRHGE